VWEFVLFLLAVDAMVPRWQVFPVVLFVSNGVLGRELLRC